MTDTTQQDDKREAETPDYGDCPMYPGESCLGECWYAGVKLVTWQRCVGQRNRRDGDGGAEQK